MKLDRILIAIGIVSLLIFFVVSNYRVLWNSDYYKWTYLISLLILVLVYLFSKNRVVIYIQILLLLLFGLGVLSYLRIPGDAFISGLANMTFLVMFIATLNYDSFKLGPTEKIYAIFLSLVLLLRPIFLLMDITPYKDIDKFAFILVLILIWPFHRNFKYKKDLYRIFILLGLLQLGIFIL